jgi:soluble lytic murein transglycosylase-like protein
VSQPSNQQSSQLPRGILGAIETAESARDTNKNQSSSGAEGPFQFMPKTAARYGVTDPHNVVQAARGAARYLSDLGTEFHHDWAKAIASYNWGEGNVERVSKQYGADWYKHLPPETSNYLAEVIGGMQ